MTTLKANLDEWLDQVEAFTGKPLAKDVKVLVVHSYLVGMSRGFAELAEAINLNEFDTFMDTRLKEAREYILPAEETEP